MLRSDAVLLASYARSRDDGAFTELVERHGALVVGACARILGRGADAEDAAQAAFLVLARRAEALDRERPLAPWLYRVAVNAAHDLRRSRESRRTREAEAARVAAPDGSDAPALSDDIDRALAGLPAQERQAMVLVYLVGLSPLACARQLGRSEGTVASWLHRARARLRARLASGQAALVPGALVGAALRHGFGADTVALLSKPPPACRPLAIANRRIAAMRVHAIALPIAAVAALLIATAVLGWRLGAAEPQARAPAAPAASASVADPAATAPAPAPTSPPTALGDRLGAPQLVLTQVHAVGDPIFSPDGRWLAVREADGGLALVDLPATLRDHALAPTRYALAAPVPILIGARQEVGCAACFSADSSQLLIDGAHGLAELDLPPTGAPRVLTRYPHGCVPALAQAPAPRGNWPCLSIDAPAGQDGNRMPTPARASLIVDDRMAGQHTRTPAPVALRVFDPVRLSRAGDELLATAADGAALVIDARTRLCRTRCSTQELAAACGGAVGDARVVSCQPGGAMLIEAARPYPEEMRAMEGTYVPGGEDAPERGRNPGDAEPGPSMPRIWLRRSPGAPMPHEQAVAGANAAFALARWWQASTARCCDTILLAPADDLAIALLLQIANFGATGEGVPTVWIGTLDRAGHRSERDLKNPFPAAFSAPEATLIQCAGDATSALVLVRTHRHAQVPVPNDAATRARIVTGLASGQLQAASRDGEEGVIRMVEQEEVFQRYERMAGSVTADQVHMNFALWQVWRFDAPRGQAAAVTPLYGEAIAPDAIAGEVGMPGAPGGFFDTPHATYSAQAGLMAVTLVAYPIATTTTGAPEPRGLQLIQLAGLGADRTRAHP